MYPKPKSRKARNNLKKQWKRMKRLNRLQSYEEFVAEQERDREIIGQSEREKEAALSANDEAEVAKFKIEQAQADARRMQSIGSNSISNKSPWDMKSVKDFTEVGKLEIGEGQAEVGPINSIKIGQGQVEFRLKKKSPSNVFEPAKSALDSLGDLCQEDEKSEEDPSKVPDLKK